MNQYGDVLYWLVLVIIFIIARIALKYIRTADLLRWLCVDYLTQIWIHRGRTPTEDEVQAEIDEALKEMEEAK